MDVFLLEYGLVYWGVVVGREEIGDLVVVVVVWVG